MTQDSCLGFLSGPQPSREASALRPSAGKRLTVTIVPCHAVSAEPKDVVSFNSAASARVSVAVLLQSRAATEQVCSLERRWDVALAAASCVWEHGQGPKPKKEFVARR